MPLKKMELISHLDFKPRQIQICRYEKDWNLLRAFVGKFSFVWMR
jgi:hypothetical protein